MMSTFQQKIKKVFDNLSNFSQIFTKLPKLSEQKKKKKTWHSFSMNCKNFFNFINKEQYFLSAFQEAAKNVSNVATSC